MSSHEDLRNKDGHIIRDAREALRMPLRDLAIASGVSSGGVNRIERGISKPRKDTRDKIYASLGLDSAAEFGDLYIGNLVLYFEFSETPDTDAPFALSINQSFSIVNPIPISRELKFHPVYWPSDDQQDFEPFLLPPSSQRKEDHHIQKGVQSRGLEFFYPQLPFGEVLMLFKHPDSLNMRCVSPDRNVVPVIETPSLKAFRFERTDKKTPLIVSWAPMGEMPRFGINGG